MSGRAVPEPACPALGQRVAAAIVVALACGAFAYAYALRQPDRLVDIDQVWYAARALLAGRDPYAEVGPGRAFDMQFELYYPLTAAVAFAPIAMLPMHLARTAFVALSTGVLALVVTRDGWWRLSIFLSGSMFMVLTTGQWSPLLTAALYAPALGALFAVKPNVGLALAAGFRTRAALVLSALGSVALLAVSLTVQPSWPREWLHAVRGAPHFLPPVRHLGGALILLGVLRWRRPEARLLVALACVPHTTLVYEALPILLVARNLRESLFLGMMSFIVYLIPVAAPQLATPVSARIHTTGALLVALVYLPALLLVLRRPNEGDVPAAVERAVAVLARMRPAWMGRLSRPRPSSTA